MGGGKVQGEMVVVKAGGGGEREWRQWWEGLRGQVVDHHLHGPKNYPGSPPEGWKARLLS